MGGNTLITHADHKKTRRRETREDLNGPRINSEEPNPIGCDAIGFKHSNPTPFSTGIPLKSGPKHRPVTKPKLFKPTLYKSYCEGSFVCEPDNIIGPPRNRVLTPMIYRNNWIDKWLCNFVNVICKTSDLTSSHVLSCPHTKFRIPCHFWLIFIVCHI